MKSAILEAEDAEGRNFGKTTSGVKHAPLYEQGMGLDENGNLVLTTMPPEDEEEAAVYGQAKSRQIEIKHRIVLRLHRWCWNDRAAQAAFLFWEQGGKLGERSVAEIIRDARCSESSFRRRLEALYALVAQWAVEEMGES